MYLNLNGFRLYHRLPRDSCLWMYHSSFWPLKSCEPIVKISLILGMSILYLCMCLSIQSPITYTLSIYFIFLLLIHFSGEELWNLTTLKNVHCSHHFALLQSKVIWHSKVTSTHTKRCRNFCILVVSFYRLCVLNTILLNNLSNYPLMYFTWVNVYFLLSNFIYSVIWNSCAISKDLTTIS